MKILHVMWSGSIGGLERHVFELCVKLKEYGHRVTTCILGRGGPIERSLTDSRIEVNTIGIHSGFNIAGIKRFNKFLEDEKFDIVHVHDRTFLPNYVIWKCCNAPKVFTEHGGEFLGNNRWKRVLFYLLFAYQYNRILVNSSHTKSNVLKYVANCGAKIEIVHYGINLARFTGAGIDRQAKRNELRIGQDRKIIGVVARLVATKGIDLFIQAARGISVARRDSTFLIVGDGPGRRGYEEMAKKIAPNTDIRFLGMREDINEILSIFDVFLFTSKRESFGIVLIEAMASGVPVVGFDIPGPNEVVENNSTALLVKPFEVNKLIANVLSLLDNNKLRDRLSQNGIKRAKELFSIDRNALRILQIYNDIKKG